MNVLAAGRSLDPARQRLDARRQRLGGAAASETRSMSFALVPPPRRERIFLQVSGGLVASIGMLGEQPGDDSFQFFRSVR